MANENSFFLSYDYDPFNSGTIEGVGHDQTDDYTYHLYAVNPVSSDTNEGHTFDIVTSFTSATQHTYFANQYVADYVPQVPGLEVLITGNFYYDSPEVENYGLKALTVSGAGIGTITDLGLTGSKHTHAINALGGIIFLQL